MANPYPAEFWTNSRDARSLVIRLGGYLNFTDNANQPGGGSISVTDGSHTVATATSLDFTSGATVTDAGGGVAQVAITGGGGGTTLDSFPFAFNTASLNGGINTGIVSVAGQALLFALLIVTATFDGTTPVFDFGVGVSGGGSGIAALVQSAPFALDVGISTGAGVEIGQSVATAVWTASGPLQVWASQDGLKGGAALGGTQGAATLYVAQTT